VVQVVTSPLPGGQMGDIERAALTVIAKSKRPIAAKDVVRRVSTEMHVSEVTGKHAVLNLLDRHEVSLTPDMKLQTASAK
jgi:hypothetical protein